MPQVVLAPLAVDEVDRVRGLWLELHHHHQIGSPVALVADDELSWAARRRLYVDWLSGGSAFALIAEQDGRAVGYAFCTLHDGPDDTFPVGARFGDVFSLAVSEQARGAGIGTALLDEVDRELERRSIHDLRISVMAGNERAQRLYERRGLRVAELSLWRFGSPGGS
jgi:ribosomal protein S18 acetylase RimI-like enzyme